MAEYDQPAAWNYILNQTGASKITYVGHSQGTTQMFASMTQYPEFYRDHLRRFVAIGPFMHLHNMESTLLQEIKDEDWIFSGLK